MLKYYIISFALLSLVFSGCGSKSPEPLDEEVLDLEYVKKIEEEERKQEEKATELLALEAALKAAEAEAEAETAAETAKETAAEAAVQEKLLAQPELQTPETNQAGAFNAIKEAVFEILTIPTEESQEIKAEKPVAVPEQEDSSPRFMPTSRLALVSALKLVSCKNVPAKMEDAHQRLLKTKDLKIADRSLRDEINDRLMPVVHFDFDQIKIKSDYQKLLRQQSSCVMKALEARGDMIMQIEGHADERGSDEYNLALGHRRANAIANSIMAYLSNSTLVRILSYGEEFPLDSNSGKTAWDKNRRVEFTLLLKP
ncbi:MAG: OmpA family protein [SAR324 cluster bacterium]|nr:OmpA family protein [SAR324 cluster bacterium]MED5434502.1 OmpA family protein [SAR324 cluster bacterium]MED5483133.1 OmpA family protein [SAR324 cluster bacterium]